MKERLLELLRCPRCRTRLEVEATEQRSGEIHSGILHCLAGGDRYPIVDFVPRFVSSEHYVGSFGFQWNRFKHVQLDCVMGNQRSEGEFGWKTGFQSGDLAGKLVLDVGVGAGRYADVVSRWGAEVVGVDLSIAVNAADETLGRRSNVHLVQADLFALPFEPASFDVLYSIGVLHHTPDTRRAFLSVAPFVKPGGWAAVWVYSAHNTWFMKGAEFWRRFTPHLPLRLVYLLSALAVPLYPVWRLPPFKFILQPLFPIAHHPMALWRWLDTFDYYTPRYQWKHWYREVWKWFREAGYVDIEPLGEDVSVRGRRPG